EWQISAADSLPHAHQIRLNALILAGEHLPRPPKPDGNLVADQQHLVLRRQSPHVAQKSVRMDDHPRRPLHDRLAATRCNAPGLPMLYQYCAANLKAISVAVAPASL